MRDLLYHVHLCERLERLLHSTDPRIRLYVYLLKDARKVKPALYAGYPIPDLCPWLQRCHGEGDYAVMIRRGETMLLTGSLSIGVPLDWRPQ